MKAAPKKRKKEDEEETKSKEVIPETWHGKCQAALPQMLKDAADARTASIKLTGMEYAGELSKQLLGHAQKLEGLYSKLNQDLASDGSTEKMFKRHMTSLQELSVFGTKAQVGLGKV